jgi:hypothetical protein
MMLATLQHEFRYKDSWSALSMEVAWIMFTTHQRTLWSREEAPTRKRSLDHGHDTYVQLAQSVAISCYWNEERELLP